MAAVRAGLVIAYLPAGRSLAFALTYDPPMRAARPASGNVRDVRDPAIARQLLALFAPEGAA